jgi:putative sterol carrier protein
MYNRVYHRKKLGGAIMAILFGTQEWVDALKKALEASQAYKEAAKKWEGDLYIIVDPDASYKHRHIVYLDLWHGECRGASLIKDESEKSPQYRIFGPFTIMKQILDKKVDAVQSMMTGKLKVQGDMAQIMRMPNAAVELVNCMTSFETVFPD